MEEKIKSLDIASLFAGNLVSLFEETKYLFGDLVWKRSQKKDMKLLQRGYFYSSDEIRHWLDKGLDVNIDSHLNIDWIKSTYLLIKDIHGYDQMKGPREKEKREHLKELNDWLYKSLCVGKAKLRHEDVVVLMLLCFFSLSEQQEKYFLKLPQEVKNRNLVISSHVVTLLFFQGVSDLKYLKNLFNCCLFFDHQYAEAIWSHQEKDQVLAYYSDLSNVSPHDREVNVDFLMFDGCESILKLNYEKELGTGKPLGLNYTECNDLELVVISMLSNVPLKETSFVFQDVEKFYKESVPRRIFNYLEQASEQNEDEKYLEVAGL